MLSSRLLTGRKGFNSLCGLLRAVPCRSFSVQVPNEKKFTLLDIKKKYKEGVPLTMVTAYDYTSAYFVDKAGIDVILVGDSLGMVMLGRKSTTDVTMEEMVHHCKAVNNGCKRAFVVADLPFGSFEASNEDAIRNACQLVKFGYASAVKIEGGKARKSTIKALVDAGIVVFGHIGLTPQTSSMHGGYRVQGRTSQDAISILEDAIALQEAGCSAIVIEFVPDALAREITKLLKIPTFGIGAGKYTSGQVLVYHDLLGLYPDFTPKFCKQYANISEEITKGLTAFKNEVEKAEFPTPAHSFTMKDEELAKTQEALKNICPTTPALENKKEEKQAEKIIVQEEQQQTLKKEKINQQKIISETKTMPLGTSDYAMEGIVDFPVVRKKISINGW